MWESAFRRIRLFIRGWTLQELLALQLGQQKDYDDHIQTGILWHQLCNADGILIWVALVSAIPCGCLGMKCPRRARRISTWSQILLHVNAGRDLLGFVKRQFAKMMFLFPPVTLTELVSLMEISNAQYGERIVTRLIELSHLGLLTGLKR